MQIIPCCFVLITVAWIVTLVLSGRAGAVLSVSPMVPQQPPSPAPWPWSWLHLIDLPFFHCQYSASSKFCLKCKGQSLLPVATPNDNSAPEWCVLVKHHFSWGFTQAVVAWGLWETGVPASDPTKVRWSVLGKGGGAGETNVTDFKDEGFSLYSESDWIKWLASSLS